MGFLDFNNDGERDHHDAFHLAGIMVFFSALTEWLAERHKARKRDNPPTGMSFCGIQFAWFEGRSNGELIVRSLACTACSILSMYLLVTLPGLWGFIWWVLFLILAMACLGLGTKPKELDSVAEQGEAACTPALFGNQVEGETLVAECSKSLQQDLVEEFDIKTKPNLFVMFFWCGKGIDGKGTFGCGTYFMLAFIALIFLGAVFEDVAGIFILLASILVFAGGPFVFYITYSDYCMFKRMYCRERGIENY